MLKLVVIELMLLIVIAATAMQLMPHTTATPHLRMLDDDALVAKP